MTNETPANGDPSESNEASSNEPAENAETAAEETPEAAAGAANASGADADATESGEADEAAADDVAEADDAAETVATDAETEDSGTDAAAPVSDSDAGAAAAAATAGAAWTTTPVAPDPEATEAALAALAAKPEVTLEPPAPPPPPPPLAGGEPPEEGTPVLLVGGILVGAFIVALAIVLVLFRPFDSGTDSGATASPSPIVIESPSAEPTDGLVVDAPDFVEQSLEEAELTADDYGLVLQVTPFETDEFEAGTVLDQDPPPGSAVEVGSTVELSVAVAVPTVDVPDIVDLPENRGRRALGDAGLVPGDRSEANDDTIVAGNIISTDPEPATEVAPASEVSYVVSSGPALVPVPEIIDIPEAAALTALGDAGLVPGDRSEANDDTIVAGNIISTDPEPATEVAPASEVSYVVSSGPALVPVPEIIDIPEAAALTALGDAGLVPGDRSEANDDTIVAGNIISTDPEPATEVAPASEVSYVVSSGPALVPVPEMIDIPEAAALTALGDAGLVPGDRSEANDDTIVAGNIISTDPEPATEVAPASEVSYVVSSGPALVPVPEIIDIPEAAALTALGDAGLVPGDRSEANDDTIVAGNIISTDPEPATEVAPASEVSYVVSSGPALVPVPEIIDIPEAAALTALGDAGLVPGDRSEANDDTIVAGNIISTDPEPATEVAPASEVSYVVSSGPALVPVPEIIDIPEAAALTALGDAGLVPGDRSEANDDTIVAGNIISTDPEPATEVAPASEVSYVVSSGPALVPVPEIIDIPEAAALTALGDAGLVPGDRSEANDDTIVAGNIISTDPEPATEVAPASEVSYVVSSGPAQVDSPEFVGLTLEEAQAAADGARVVLVTQPVETGEAEPGTILDQDPAAGTPVDVGSTITVFVAVPPTQTTVPDLSGPAADAEQTLSDAGLVAAPSDAFSDSVPAGDVISQAPAAGASADVGSSVSYVVSLGIEQTTVPDLSGPAADAEQTLSDAGLVAAPSDAFSDSVPAGDVISQAPAAGASADVGSSVSYVVSLGIEQTTVPDLSGPAADAEQTLSDAGLVAAPSDAFSDSVPAGDVISQAPAAGASADVGSSVSYVVSLGIEQTTVPDLSGPAADAEQTLSDAGLVAAPSDAFSDSVPAGDVISQAPAAGASADVGSSVSYVVSLGIEQTTVPDLSGPAADAEQTLSDAGLVAAPSDAFSDSVPAGDVISQAPAAGASADVGSSVSYVVSLGIEQTTVPDLSGPAADAEQTLSDAGLVAAPSDAFSDSVPAGDVISQAPAAGASADVGSSVSYVVSLGIEQTTVPDLSGPAADAEQTLSDAGLVAAPSDAFSDSVPAGDVISQAPAAGASADVGSSVSYVVSLGIEQTTVPDLSGPAADAEQTLSDAGLVAAPSDAFSDSVPAGDVISQAPAAGASADVGSSVSYVVSLGIEQTTVPDLSGPAADAEQTLSDAGLVAAPSDAFSDSVPAGDVISQAPAAGASADVGSSVSYVVSLGIEQTTVPDLSGPAADAEQTLSDAGLVAAPSDAFSDSVPAGDVISQAPAAGASADVGSSVSYVVSLGIEQTTVPDLSGPAADAEQTLSDAGLVAAPSDAFSDSVPAGDVISQAPAAGASADVGSSVSYVVSLGIEQTTVPDLSGPAADAEQTLSDAGLVAAPSDAFSDSVPAGDVISQAPAAGASADVGSSVSYVVSLGIEQTTVPDLSGPAADAEQTLSDAGLVAAPSDAFSDSVPAGDVISQAPAAGASADVGSSVSYVVSLGIEQTTVPDLSGPAADAEQTLSDAGLVAAPSDAFSDSVPAGDVISQAPAAGASADVGSSVSYVVSLGIEQTTVPDLSGPAADAEQTLSDAGLVAAPSDAFSDSVPAGDVISQAPAAGASADVGSSVSYVVSLGVAPDVTIPAVRDLPEADAIATVQDAGLVVGEVITRSNENVEAGNAIRTTPAVDSDVPVGSELKLIISSGSSTTSVPDVKGLPEADAIAALEAAGLGIGETRRPTNGGIPAGSAVKTDPAADATVELGSAVTLFISSGPKQVVVPDIVGSTKAAADAAIAAAELKVGETSSIEDVAPRNTVLSQEPAALAEVDKNSLVDYVLSAGSPETSVPDVKGLPEADAIAALEAAGLGIGETRRPTNGGIPAGSAVKTDPAADATVELGSAVTLFISSGPKQVVVPDIVGSTKAAADAAIAAAELKVGETSSIEDVAPRNTVLSQEPAALAEVDKNSLVDYVLSAGSPETSVPDVKGLPEADAIAALEAAGLGIGETRRPTNGGIPAGSAVKTDPAADATVELGSAVTLFISSGPKQVVVPDIVGSTKAAADAAIAAAELKVGETSSIEDVAPRNTVLSQEPAALAEVDKNSLVDYVLSAGSPETSVPDVKGLPEADAIAALEAAGLGIGETRRPTNGGIPAGSAVKTDPAADATVELGSAVTLFISSGPKQVVVPDIVGSTKAAADAAIAAAELKVGETSSIEDVAPRNTVLSQEPAALAEVDKNSLVDYVLSAGSPETSVPDVKGLPEADAIAALEAAGLGIGETRRPTNGGIPAGSAVKTDPAADATVELGSAVTLFISSGPKQVVVPDIVGSTKAAADAAIAAAELKVGETSSIEDVAPRNTVLSQEPAALAEVDKNSLVDYVLSAGSPETSVPDVKGLPEADAIAALEAAGLGIGETRRPTNGGIPAGSAVKTDPAADATVELGSAVTLFISSGPKQVVVPDIVGSTKAAADAAIAAAELKVGDVGEANDDAIPAGSIVSQDPRPETVLDKNSTVSYVVSAGPVIEPFGLGGDLDNSTVSGQLDAVATAVTEIRGLPLRGTPYDAASKNEQKGLLSERAALIYDPSTIGREQKALRRMGLLPAGADLASLLDELYGQALPMAYLEQRGRQSILSTIKQLNPAQQALAAREFGRADVDQSFGIAASRSSDHGDAALAELALEQGDGTVVMLDWSAANLSRDDQTRVDGVIVPGNDSIFASMPQLLQREYSLPFLEGRIFVRKVRADSGWGGVNQVWRSPPESTEQIMHPNKYPADRPTNVSLDGLAGTFGGGWSEDWQQTMGELRTGVWLADGKPGQQDAPSAAVKLPKANAAAGWGGDTLVSLDGPDGSWALVWQSKWDKPEDVGQFTDAATQAMADLPGAHVALAADVSGGLSNPALVVMTSDADTLAAVQAALGVGG